MRPIRFLAMIATLLCAITATAQQNDVLKQANADYDAGNYGAAAAAYAKVPASMIDRSTRLRWARSLSWSGQLDAAERMYSRVRREGNRADVDADDGQLLSWMGASRAAGDTPQNVYA